MARYRNGSRNPVTNRLQDVEWAFENRPKKVGDSLLKWLEQPTCDGHIIVETKSHGGT